ncbi:MAG: altronate dehydratase family protein [Saprospiraceae bacterium]
MTIKDILHKKEQISYLKIHSNDNVMVALRNLNIGDRVHIDGEDIILSTNVKAKHKFSLVNLDKGDDVFMYGIKVGKAKYAISKGEVLTTENVIHQTTDVKGKTSTIGWSVPNVEGWKETTLNGIARSDNSVGTANYWIVFPLVFCENRNIELIKDAIMEALGQNSNQKYRSFARKALRVFIDSQQNNIETSEELFVPSEEEINPFPNVDGVQFITHQMGCGGTRQDAETLCGLLAGYVTHPNVAGVTVLSLGCQNAQFSILEREIKKRSPNFNKPIYYFDQQTLGTEEKLIQQAIKSTLAGMAEANKITRNASPLNNLVVGLECGGSDGFSGISANPLVGYVSDMIVALGGTVILSEFPELCGVEQELVNRCVSEDLSVKFLDLMERYEKTAIDAGSGFDMNPSPGNIKDGLITDAMKSAGAAKKGGTSPITDILDYPEKVTKKGLNLLCTPGNDVESTTALAGSGANVILFTTGLGTPTGNPIVPVIKISSNSEIAAKMSDIIDFDAGTIIRGEESIEEAAQRLLKLIIEVASNEKKCKAVINRQQDFIPWKRGISL